MEEKEISSLGITDTPNAPQEMNAKLIEMKQQTNLIQKFFKEVMVQNQDYGVIQGTEKPTLLKPGAEKLCELYGYAPTIKSIEEVRDVQAGFYSARVTIALIHRYTNTLIAEGVGEANSMEGRYRWRWIPEWKVPNGVDASVLHFEERKGKNGKNYKLFRVENEDVWTLWNTVLKMAKKRAMIDATLSATRSSGIFTQDVEDLQEWVSAAQPVEYPAEPKQMQVKNTENISQAQAKRLFALAKGRDKIVRDVLDKYGFQFSTDVSRDKYTEVCDLIEQMSTRPQSL
jgi:hypothetical protein